MQTVLIRDALQSIGIGKNVFLKWLTGKVLTVSLLHYNGLVCLLKNHLETKPPLFSRSHNESVGKVYANVTTVIRICAEWFENIYLNTRIQNWKPKNSRHFVYKYHKVISTLMDIFCDESSFRRRMVQASSYLIKSECSLWERHNCIDWS